MGLCRSSGSSLYKHRVSDLCGHPPVEDDDNRFVSIAIRFEQRPFANYYTKYSYRAVRRVRRDQSRTAENREALEFEPNSGNTSANPSSERWSGARDLNPGPHGPEVWAVSSTEIDFDGFEIDWGVAHAFWTGFKSLQSRESLHELLHEKALRSGSQVGRRPASSPAPHKRRPRWRPASQ